MSKLSNKRTSNTSPSRAFHLVIVAVLMLLAWIISNKFISLASIPWSVLTILLLPIASSATLFHKLAETKKNVADDLRKSERRRLASLVKSKSRTTFVLMIIQIVIISFVTIVSLANENPAVMIHIKVISNLVVCSMIFSLYSLVPVLLGVREVIEFETLIKTRKAINKRKNEALSKLAK